MKSAEAKELLGTRSADRWKRLGTSRRAGIVAPLFSVYSKSSIGIGSFGDMKFLVDFCRKVGASILQLMPMNEVGATFCPYDSISAFALEPVYISLTKFPKDKTDGIRKVFPAGRPHVDYGVKRRKEGMLWEAYLEKPPKKSKEFIKFEKGNSYWLDDFALFKTIKYHQAGKPWYEWQAPYRDRDAAGIESFRKEREKEISFQKHIQWIAYKQFKEARAYAESKNVLIKGDLPILVSRDSADVWAHREFFKLDFDAGAPPDMYCAKGQRWGMPIYDWINIAADNYTYIKEKLKFAENFYDVLRIDHVVGLFRIWSIPYNEPGENEGLNGSFDPKDESSWAEHGNRLLSVISENTNSLLCAEDLGVIPNSCPETLKKFGIPGNSVQRWVKDWVKSHDFLTPEEYRLMSVAMLSTHDTTNWAAWWENEAGTIDEALFTRKCKDRGIDYGKVKAELFDPSRSRHGRLRWLESVDSPDRLAAVLDKPKDRIGDFIDMYENTYKEKERLWNRMRPEGAMREKSDPEILASALKITLGSKSIFCIELLTDYLNLAGLFKGDPYDYRINRPGTISGNNWSMTMPVPLEKLVKHGVCKVIKKMIVSSGRRDGKA